MKQKNKHLNNKLKKWIINKQQNYYYNKNKN